MVMLSIWDSLLVALVVQLIMFIPAFIFMTDKLTDASYSFTFIILAIISLLPGYWSFTKILLFAMILIWALRLLIYLVVRIGKTKTDARFDDVRGSFFKFLGFWVFQGITVWAVLLASLLFFNAAGTSFTALTAIGFALWLVGLLIESIADYQKYSFRSKKENQGKFVQSGLWKCSRHPNYFGEMLIWAGIYVFTLPTLIASSNWLIGLISPLYIIILLRFVSGVPLLEKNSDKKYRLNKDYWRYKRRTSMIMPWFVRKH